MAKQPGRRQRTRKALLIGSLLFFPVTLYYFSPALIIQSAAAGVVNGSLIVFASMFLASLFFGRLWCGWACPAAALQEISTAVNNGPFKTGRRDRIKWLIWTPWIALIAFMALQAGGYHQVNFFYETEQGLSVTNWPGYIVYYVVTGLFLALAWLAGRRAACHTLCWMAPFMILGRALRNAVRWPALRLVADPARCSDCKTCTTNCPMSLDVNGLVHAGSMEHRECILCGTCVDGCAKDAIRYSFSAGTAKTC
ncbi:MAG TPA: 4Fe-4S binding protein [Anaerolineae bacterium]